MPKAKDLPPEEVRATYRLHDEIESNPASRELFEANPPELDDVQQEVVDDLFAQGYCLMPITKLLGTAAWDQLAADAAIFTREMERQLDGGFEPVKVKKIKPGKPGKPAKPEKVGKVKAFMGRRYKKDPLTLESPWLELAASSRMLDIVNTYLGMWSKLSYADQWYSPPRGSEADRVGSMRWHRDYNDQHLVKVFVYLVDVDEGTGPLEYIPGSARQGPFSHEWAWAPLGESYPPEEEFSQRIPDSAVKTFTGPAGSIIFADTSGFHRGGYAKEKARNAWVYNYVSPAALVALVDRNFDVDESEIADRPATERFALS
jgi:hypothetical protein